VQRLTVLRPLYDRGVRSSLSRKTVNGATGAPSVPMFTHTVKDGKKSFSTQMVGKDPFTDLRKPKTTVNTVVVPVIIKLSNGDTFDPTQADSCAPASSLHRTLTSPLFASKTYTWGGTPVGTGQYVSIFRRAEFYHQTKPGALNPGYQVNLTAGSTTPITVNVPLADSAEGTLTCGPLGAMEISWWDNYVRTTLMPQLASRGYGSDTFPIFLLSNVVEYITTTTNCCVLGYHNAFVNPADNGVTTYATSLYDNTHGRFTGTQDISALSHEIGEWMDDPYGTNPTKPWGHIGQVSGCQGNLEVGDPLSGTLQNTKLGVRTWHPQELAFYSWFYHQTPSLGVNGWYSSHGTFTAHANHCK
jgi:hypothetical protein